MWEGEHSQQRLWWERVVRLGGKSKQALNVSEEMGQGGNQGQDHRGPGCCGKDFGFHVEGCETIRGFCAEQGCDLIHKEEGLLC